MSKSVRTRPASSSLQHRRRQEKEPLPDLRTLARDALLDEILEAAVGVEIQKLAGAPDTKDYAHALKDLVRMCLQAEAAGCSERDVSDVLIAGEQEAQTAWRSPNR